MSKLDRLLKREGGIKQIEPPMSETQKAKLLAKIRSGVTEDPLANLPTTVALESGFSLESGQYIATTTTFANGRTSVTFE